MKYKIVVYLFFFVVSAIWGSSCQNRPKEVLNRKHMERLMYDVYVAEALMDNDYQNFDTPQKKEALIRKIFEKHTVTQAQWDTSLSWYSDRIDLYLRMNDSVKVRIQRNQRAIDAQISRQYAEDHLQTLSPSYIPPFYSFATPDTRKGFRFRLDSTEIYSRIPEDHFSFRFSVMGIPSEKTPDFLSLLTLEYRDTTIYRPQRITDNQFYTIPVSKYILDDTLKQLSGFIHLQDTSGLFGNIRLHSIFLGSNIRHSRDSVNGIPFETRSPEGEQVIRMDSLKMQ